MKQAALFPLVILVLASCSSGPNGGSSSLTSPSSLIALSGNLNEPGSFTFVTTPSHIVTIARKRGALWIIRYSASGAEQAEFLVPNQPAYSVIRDIAADDHGNIALLKCGEDGHNWVEVLNESGEWVGRSLPLRQAAQHIVFTLGQVFAISDTHLIRADDDSVIAQLPHPDSYCFLATKDQKLVALSQTIPLMFTYDLATTKSRVYQPDAPELQGNARKPAESTLIAGAAVDDEEAIYAALPPEHFRLSVLKMDESGRTIGKLELRLPAIRTNQSVPIDIRGGIGCLGHRLLAYSPSDQKIAFYPTDTDNEFVP